MIVLGQKPCFLHIKCAQVVDDAAWALGAGKPDSEPYWWIIHALRARTLPVFLYVYDTQFNIYIYRVTYIHFVQSHMSLFYALF